MKYFSLLLIALVSFSTSTFAQEETDDAGIELTGFVDVYYQYNFNGVALGTTSFTPDHNSFSLGMAKLGLTKEVGKVSFGVDLGFGPRADAANGYAGTSFGPVQQLYVAYAPNDKLTFTAGNFGTHVGYEIIDANGNFHYSTSYMFSYGPFYHTGVKADIALTDNLGMMVGIFNDTDAKFDAVGGKHLGAQLSYSTEVGDIYLNYLGGKDGADSTSFNQVDLTAAFGLTDELSLGVNATVRPSTDTKVDGMGEATWFGAALYLDYAVSETLSLGVRGEYLNDDDAYLFGTTDLNIIDLTASANIIIDNLTIIPELRIDLFSEDIIADIDGNAVGTSPTFILAAVYSF